MVSKKKTIGKGPRVIKYTGNIETDSLFISNHGNVSATLKGTFKISGMVYCPRYDIFLDIKGQGQIFLRGICQRLVIKINGDCLLDLSEMTIGEVFCEAKGNSSIKLGNTKVICRAELHDEAIVLLVNETLIFNVVKLGRSKILTASESLP